MKVIFARVIEELFSYERAFNLLISESFSWLISSKAKKQHSQLSPEIINHNINSKNPSFQLYFLQAALEVISESQENKGDSLCKHTRKQQCFGGNNNMKISSLKRQRKFKEIFQYIDICICIPMPCEFLCSTS